MDLFYYVSRTLFVQFGNIAHTPNRVVKKAPPIGTTAVRNRILKNINFNNNSHGDGHNILLLCIRTSV